MHTAVVHHRRLLPLAWAGLAAVAAGVWITGRAVASADLAVLLTGAAVAWALVCGGAWRVPLAVLPVSGLALSGGLWGTAAVCVAAGVLGLPRRRVERPHHRIVYRPDRPPASDIDDGEFDAEERDDGPDPVTDDDAPTHWQTRTRTAAGGERVEGETTLSLPAGCRTTAGHVVFFPPLAAAPEVHAEPHTFGVRVRVTAATPGGFRFEVKREDAGEDEVRVAWWGTAP